MIIKGYEIEFLEDTHTYVVDGIILPSITQMLQLKFGNKYSNVNPKTLENASIRGTLIHKAIEDYEVQGIENDSKELHNYKFLKKAYKFECLKNEVPVLLFDNDKPIACGRLDLLIEKDNKKGIGDIKSTSVLDKNYLAYQLNLYRLAYQQSYGEDIDFLCGLHLREDKRKYVDIPIIEDFIKDFIEEWKNETSG